MSSLKGRLPPLCALVTFEAAARHLSFTRAGEELHVTQAAVSRQIKLLEESLGVVLFERGHRSLTPTAAATKLHQAVSMGLERIGTTVAEIRSSHRDGPLTVSATIAFASLWLNSRLPEFHHRYPHIDVRILATDRDVDLHGEGVDIAFGCGDYDQRNGIKATHLFDDEVFPVCSPGYLEAHPDLKTAADLPDQDLLHLDEDHWHAISWEPTDWSIWLKSQGVESLQQSHGIWINNYPLLLQTAINSQGVALGWRHLINDLLEEGLLVSPVPETLHTQRGYYMVESTLRPQTDAAVIFSQWITESVR